MSVGLPEALEPRWPSCFQPIPNKREELSHAAWRDLDLVSLRTESNNELNKIELTLNRPRRKRNDPE
jgi:hypothetical protein